MELYQVGKMMEKIDAILSEQGKQFVAMLKEKQTAANEALLHAWINGTDQIIFVNKIRKYKHELIICFIALLR